MTPSDPLLDAVFSWIPACQDLSKALNRSHGLQELNNDQVGDLAGQLYTVASAYEKTSHWSIKPARVSDKLAKARAAVETLRSIKISDKPVDRAVVASMSFHWDHSLGAAAIDIEEWFAGLERIRAALEYTSIGLGQVDDSGASKLNESLTAIFQGDFDFPVGVGSKNWLIGWALPSVFETIYPGARFGRADDDDRRAGPLYTFVARAFELIEGIEMSDEERTKFAARVMTARVRTGHSGKHSVPK